MHRHTLEFEREQFRVESETHHQTTAVAVRVLWRKFDADAVLVKFIDVAVVRWPRGPVSAAHVGVC